MASLKGCSQRVVGAQLIVGAQKGATNLPYRLDVLRRNRRLSRRDQIEEITKKGDKKDSRFLVARSRVNELKYNRYGIVVSLKMEKSAVKRNKIRRQIYEIIHILEKSGAVPKSPTFDIVLFARKPLLTEDFNGLQNAVKEILTKIYE